MSCDSWRTHSSIADEPPLWRRRLRGDVALQTSRDLTLMQIKSLAGLLRKNRATLSHVNFRLIAAG
jgi:hypothetical protein